MTVADRFRMLSDARPERFTRDLANAIDSAGNALQTLERWPELIDLISEENLGVFRAMADADPAASLLMQMAGSLEISPAEKE